MRHVPGEPSSVPPLGEGDRAVAVTRAWRPGDELQIELPVRPRWTYPDPRIDAVRGTVAVERGPLVYCEPPPARTQTLVPYPLWSNRGPSTMRVWLPLNPARQRR